jgi:hypothetical protein
LVYRKVNSKGFSVRTFGMQLAHNVFGLGEGGGFLAQKFNRITNDEFTTSAPLLPSTYVKAVNLSLDSHRIKFVNY